MCYQPIEGECDSSMVMQQVNPFLLRNPELLWRISSHGDTEVMQIQEDLLSRRPNTYIYYQSDERIGLLATKAIRLLPMRSVDWQLHMLVTSLLQCRASEISLYSCSTSFHTPDGAPHLTLLRVYAYTPIVFCWSFTVLSPNTFKNNHVFFLSSIFFLHIIGKYSWDCMCK